MKHTRRLPVKTAQTMIKGTTIMLFLFTIMLLTGCYNDNTRKHDALTEYSEKQLDSLSFSSTHHYSHNYNFIIKKDSLVLLKQQPEELLSDMMIDSITVFRHDRIVVADIRIIPADPSDSVWVQVAKDQYTFGWIHESSLLPAVVPSDPISQFISTFSDTHLLIFLIIISLISVAYLMRTIFRRNAKIVHFNDINTFYPTLLALIVAFSATFYSAIQVFAPEVWRHFYYHPTLNPFILPLILAAFLISVWAMLITAIATVDVVRKMLPAGEALLYLCGLAGICAINYIVFSISTLYYIGFVLLPVYVVFSIRAYLRHAQSTYLCGNCGAMLKKKGRCPECGRINQ